MIRLLTVSGGALAVATSLVAAVLLAQTAAGASGVPATYLRLGIEHILFGFDHLLFILALIILIRDWRRVALTVTAFAVAHSITLAAATLGLVHVRGPLVEAAIAFSIVLVAIEIVVARRGAPSLTGRWPWLVAFCFGLLHGLGLADALTEAGLPTHAITAALLFFNLGVEIGQLAFVAAVLLAGEFVRRAMTLRLEPISLRSAADRLDVTAACAIGALAGFWLIERTSALFA